MSHSYELQTEIVAIFKADPTLIALVGGRVYDHVPNNAVSPYIAIDDFDELDNSTSTTSGVMIDGTISYWFEGTRRGEVKQALSKMRDLLHFQAFALPNYPTTWIMVDSTRAEREPDQASYHGILRFTAKVE